MKKRYYVAVAEQECSECCHLLEASKFYRASENRSGLSKVCKACQAKLRSIPKEKLCKECKETRLASEFNLSPKSSDGLQWHCKSCHRGHMYQRKYGISLAEYNLMFEWQDGNCLICGVYYEDAREGLLIVDHDHTNSRVRGLLCKDCNVMLGMASDIPEILLLGAEYLKGFKEVEDAK